MIVTAIISAFLGVLTWLLGLMPSWTLPDPSSAITAATDSRIWQFYDWTNWYFPLTLAITLLALRIAIQLALYGWEFISWAATKLHILGGAQ